MMHKNHEYIEELDLINNLIGQKFMDQFGKVLSKFSSLNHLDLSNNALSKEGFKALQPYLKLCKKLKFI
ncbi:MAG: hypothetical protein ACKOAD_04230 [Gammaproteobacteria bacterium]